MSTMKPSFKRPFQPSIGSYFGHSSKDTENFPTPRISVPAPTLPATIQSSLLNVGMRIRKSVPEGYKTRPKTFGGSATAAWDTSSHLADCPNRRSRNASTGVAGLVPYCGMLKVGGHTTQPVPAEEDLPPLQYDHDDWGIPSSQESNNSAVSAATINAAATTTMITTTININNNNNNNKRRREDADEEDLDMEAQPVSPRSRPVSHTRMPNLDQLRCFAIPKTRKKVVYNEGIRESEMIDVGGDFGEAAFFQPDEWGGGWSEFDRT